MKSISLFTLGLFVMIMVEACSDTEPMEIPISLDIPGKFTYISDNEIHVLEKDQFLSTNNCNNNYASVNKYDTQWILSGSRILYRSAGFCPNSGIHVMDPASGQNQFLIDGSNGVLWNAVTNLSGQRIAVIGQDMLAIYQYDGLSVQKIDSTPAYFTGRLSLSPDDETVVVLGTGWFGSLSIHRLGMGGLFQPGGENFSYSKTVSWSNQSDQFVFDAADDSYVSSDIYVSTYDGNEVRNLTSSSDEDETSPAWSPVADEIVFVRSFLLKDRVELVLYDLKLNEGDVILRHDDFVDIKGLQWSQDGSKIAFYNDAEFNGGIYVIDRSGSELTRYTNKGWEFDWIYP